MGHFASAQQASTWLRGPETNNLTVQVVDFKKALGKDLGTSPWHVVSPRRYGDSDAVTLWGASLTDAYRFVINGDRFEATDRSAINWLPVSIPWHFIGVDNGRFIVPDADGHKVSLRPRDRTDDPTLLVFSDDGRLDGRMKLERRVVIPESAFRRVCGVDDGEFFQSGTLLYLIPMFSEHVATTAVFRHGEVESSYLVILDSCLKPVAAKRIADSNPSNGTAAEPVNGNGTAFYIPTDKAIVKMVFNPKSSTVQRCWERRLPVRTRLGTTPTLMNTPSGEKFVLVVDAKAAVVAGLNGLIAANADSRPSTLVAVRREDDLGGRDAIITTKLPDWLTTVENSPAVRGDVIVIANYSGYLPNGLIVPAGGKAPPANASSWGKSPDARADFATGIIVLQYAAKTDSFRTLWVNSETQISGVPTISGGSNMVYGSGAEQKTRKTYFYGFRLTDDDKGRAGERIIRCEIGNAPFRETTTDFRGNVVFNLSDYKLAEGEVFDAGSNLLILEDGSAIISGGRGLVRIRDAK